MYPSPRIGYLQQLGILLGLFGAATILAALLVAGLMGALLHLPMAQLETALQNPQYANVSRLVQGLGALVGLGLPALVFARLVYPHPLEQLGFRASSSGRQWLYVLLLAYAALFASGALGELNEKIPLSRPLTAYFKQLEQSYNEQVLAIGYMRNRTDLLYALVILALLPALTEELLFRGCLQQIMTGWTRSAFWGILLTSIVFSAIHFSYYGFLPRLFLGMLLGYIFQYSKNTWLNMGLHFFNNAVVVFGMYQLSKTGKLNAAAMNENTPLYWGLPALLVVAVLLVLFRKESLRLQPAASLPAAPPEEQTVSSNP